MACQVTRNKFDSTQAKWNYIAGMVSQGDSPATILSCMEENGMSDIPSSWLGIVDKDLKETVVTLLSRPAAQEWLFKSKSEFSERVKTSWFGKLGVTMYTTNNWSHKISDVLLGLERSGDIFASTISHVITYSSLGNDIDVNQPERTESILRFLRRVVEDHTQVARTEVQRCLATKARISRVVSRGIISPLVDIITLQNNSNGESAIIFDGLISDLLIIDGVIERESEWFKKISLHVENALCNVDTLHKTINFVHSSKRIDHEIVLWMTLKKLAEQKRLHIPDIGMWWASHLPPLCVVDLQCVPSAVYPELLLAYRFVTEPGGLTVAEWDNVDTTIASTLTPRLPPDMVTTPSFRPPHELRGDEKKLQRCFERCEALRCAFPLTSPLRQYLEEAGLECPHIDPAMLMRSAVVSAHPLLKEMLSNHSDDTIDKILSLTKNFDEVMRESPLPISDATFCSILESVLAELQILANVPSSPPDKDPQKPELFCGSIVRQRQHDNTNSIDSVLSQLACKSFDVEQQLELLRIVIKFAALGNDLSVGKRCEESLTFLSATVNSFSSDDTLEALLSIVASECVGKGYPTPAVVSCGIIAPLIEKWYIVGERKIDHLFLDLMPLREPSTLLLFASRLVEQHLRCAMDYLTKSLQQIDPLKGILELMAADRNPRSNELIGPQVRERYERLVWSCVERTVACQPKPETLVMWATMIPIKMIEASAVHNVLSTALRSVTHPRDPLFDLGNQLNDDIVLALRNRLNVESESALFERFDSSLPAEAPLKVFTSSMRRELDAVQSATKSSREVLQKILTTEQSLSAVKMLLSANVLVQHALRDHHGSLGEEILKSLADGVQDVFKVIASKAVGPVGSAEEFRASLDSLVNHLCEEVTCVVNPQLMTVEKLRSRSTLREHLRMPNLLTDLDAKYDKLLSLSVLCERLYQCLPSSSPLRNWLLEHAITAPTINENALLSAAKVEFHPLLLEVDDATSLLDVVFSCAESDRETFEKHTWRLEGPQSGQTLESVVKQLIVNLRAEASLAKKYPANGAVHHDPDIAESAVTLPKLSRKRRKAYPKIQRCDVGTLVIGTLLLGSGSTCTVQQATWHGTAYAFKKYHPHVSNEIGREVNIAPFLQHEFTVRVFAIVEEQKQPIGFLMDLCDCTISSALRDPTRAPLPFFILLRWLHEIAQAIEFAHRLQCRSL